MLTAGAPFPREERRGDGLGGGVGTRLIGHDISDQVGNRHFGIHLDCAVAREALDDRVVDPSLAIGAIGAVARDRAVDEIRVERTQVRITEAQAIRCAGPPILHEDIRFTDQPMGGSQAFFPGQVEGDGSLVAIAIGVERGEPAPGDGIEAQGVSRRNGFEFDDVRPLVSQHHRRQGSRDHCRCIHHLDPLERSGQPSSSYCQGDRGYIAAQVWASGFWPGLGPDLVMGGGGCVRFNPPTDPRGPLERNIRPQNSNSIAGALH